MELIKSNAELVKEIEDLRLQLEEANEAIEAIRTGQIDALVVHGEKGHELYTLKTADQTYRVFIEKMTEGAVTLNREGIVLYSNTQFASMLNQQLSQVIGLSFRTFISPEYISHYDNLIEKCWIEDCKGEVVLTGNHKLTPVQLSLTTLQLDEGVCLSVILTDLTLQKETQRQLKLNNEQLEEINIALAISNHDLKQFAYAASHDLQEPLRKILTFSHLLKEKGEVELSDDAKKYIDKIMTSSERMKGLIQDILNYSKLSEEDDRFELVDLNEIMNELLEDLEIMIQEKKVIISIDKLPIIEAKKGALLQVFQNLLNNAIKFSRTNEKPVISITTKCINENSFDSVEKANGAYCCISIKDNGIGFAKQYEEDVFTLFRRLHTKDKYEGTGIGLAITKKIVERHNGQIIARSKEGSGAEFILILPTKQGKIKQD